MLAEELGLPGPGVRAAVISRNKLTRREVFGRTGLNQPEYLHARDVRAAESFAAGRYPVVLKPLSSMGGLGVRIAADRHELWTWANEQPANASFLVEEYLDGPEFSVEALIVDGAPVFESVTAKTTPLRQLTAVPVVPAALVRTEGVPSAACHKPLGDAVRAGARPHGRADFDRAGLRITADAVARHDAALGG